MANFHLKKKSKRMTCRKKYKIQKKIKEHHRKVRKEAKKNPKSKKAPKDPGCPNSAPFKDQVLKEAEDLKQRILEEKRKRKEERQNQFNKNRDLESLAEDAEKKTQHFSDQQANNVEMAELEESGQIQAMQGFNKDYNKVVEMSDIILHVLDARDPLGTCFPQLEHQIKNSPEPKKLIYVLNKIDLIPRDVLMSWLKYLRTKFPTVPFKASTQSQKRNLGQSKMKFTKAMAGREGENPRFSTCIGANLLMKVIGGYCPSNNPCPMTIGVVGFPNVGKSSIINSLKRSRKCTVAALPGCTRSLQVISLEHNLHLVDSPGVVLDQANSDASALLRNAVKVETIKDPLTPAGYIVQRAGRQQMALHYKIQSFKTTTELCSILAKKMGRLKKGGVPDLEAGARKLIQDWNSGKIKYYTLPPEIPSSDAMDAQDLPDDLTEQEENELKGLNAALPQDCFSLTSQLEDVPKYQILPQAEPSTSKTTSVLKTSVDDSPKHHQMDHRAMYKMLKKKRKRAEKLATKLSNELEAAMSLDPSNDRDSQGDD